MHLIHRKTYWKPFKQKWTNKLFCSEFQIIETSWPITTMSYSVWQSTVTYYLKKTYVSVTCCCHKSFAFVVFQITNIPSINFSVILANSLCCRRTHFVESFPWYAYAFIQHYFCIQPQVYVVLTDVKEKKELLSRHRDVPVSVQSG